MESHGRDLLQEMKRYSSVLPMVNQVEFHPYLFQEELLDYCKDNHIVLEAYRPLTNGQKMNNEILDEIGKKYIKTNAQILIRWSMQNGCVPLPKSIHKERIEENINVFDFELSLDEMVSINSLNENFHLSPDPTNLE